MSCVVTHMSRIYHAYHHRPNPKSDPYCVVKLHKQKIRDIDGKKKSWSKVFPYVYFTDM